MQIRIGHPSYRGANACAIFYSADSAIDELVCRGVAPGKAVDAVKRAVGGSHVVVENRALNAVELVRINE